MLARVGRWLRAAGYDTAIPAPGTGDRALLDTAIAERRMLLTRDRAIAGRIGAAGYVLVLTADGLDATARELRDRLGIDWLRSPFTRCVVDNAILQPCSETERGLMPPDAHERGEGCTACPTCGRIYWVGSHHARMRARLAKWAGERG
jgi:uncharacterized protein with PIN domain